MVIGALRGGGARAAGLMDVVLTGKLLRVRPFVERIKATRFLFERNFLIPPHAEYATAIGAARSIREQG